MFSLLPDLRLFGSEDCIVITWHMPSNYTALLPTSSLLHRPLLAPRLMSGLSCCHAVRAVLHQPLSSTRQHLLQHCSSSSSRMLMQQHHSHSRRSHLLGLHEQVGTVQTGVRQQPLTAFQPIATAKCVPIMCPADHINDCFTECYTAVQRASGPQGTCLS